MEEAVIPDILQGQAGRSRAIAGLTLKLMGKRQKAGNRLSISGIILMVQE